MDLGPRVTVDVTNTQRSSLEQPEEWFVALDIYMADNPGVEVKESDKCWEWMNNQWVEGVSWFLHYGFFVLLYSFSKLQRINVCIQSCHQYHPYLR
jgi:hypothetical protein